MNESQRLKFKFKMLLRKMNLHTASPGYIARKPCEEDVLWRKLREAEEMGLVEQQQDVCEVSPYVVFRTTEAGKIFLEAL